MSILKIRNNFRPFEYNQAFKFMNDQLNNHWVPDEIEVTSDLLEYKTSFTASERHGINTVLKLFTTYEINVSDYWIDVVYKWFPVPEIRMMASTFSAMEAVHATFYDKLNEALGLSTKKFYLSFLEEPAMKRRMDLIGKYLKVESEKDLPLSLAAFSFVEGVVLYSSFAFLLSFQKEPKNKLSNICTGLSFSTKDECLAEGTEVLTPNGWVDLSKITTSDKVLQYDPNLKTTSFINPSRVVEKDYKGKMIHFNSPKGPGMEQLVTPNHRMLRLDRNQENPEFVLASDCSYHCYNYVPIIGELESDNSNKLTSEEKFYIMTQADGSVSDRYTGEKYGTRPVSFSFSKERKINKFLEIVGDLGYSYKTTTEESRGNRNSQQKYIVAVPIKDYDFNSLKNFNWVNISNVSSEWCKEFIEELVCWDGYIPDETKNSGKYLYFSSTNKSVVEKARIVATLAGYNTSTSIQEDFRSEKFSDMYRLYIHKNKKVKNGSSIKKEAVEYEGKVRCLTVPTGAFVVRYNNKISVTGNCLHADADSWLFNTLVKEQGIDVKTELMPKIHDMAREFYELEATIIDEVFSKGEIKGIDPENLKRFVKSRINKKLKDIKMLQLYPKKEYDNNVEEWFFAMINSVEFTDFFSNNSTAYQNKYNFNKITKW